MQNFLGRALTQPSLGITRREMIRIGGLSMAGVALSDLVAGVATGAATDAERAKHGPGFGRAKNCIILYLSGGNPQHAGRRSTRNPSDTVGTPA